MAGIREIAEKAGVSISTVSNVLHHKNSASKETREKIFAIAQELGYEIPGERKEKNRTIVLNFSDFAGELVFDSYHIPEAANILETDSSGDGEERFCELITMDKGFRGDTSWSLTKKQESDVRIALASRHTVSKEEGEEIVLREEGERLITRIRIPAQKAEKVTLFKYITVSDSIRQKDPNTHAYSVLKKAISSDIRDLYEKQSTYLCSVFPI